MPSAPSRYAPRNIPCTSRSPAQDRRYHPSCNMDARSTHKHTTPLDWLRLRPVLQDRMVDLRIHAPAQTSPSSAHGARLQLLPAHRLPAHPGHPLPPLSVLPIHEETVARLHMVARFPWTSRARIRVMNRDREAGLVRKFDERVACSGGSRLDLDDGISRVRSAEDSAFTSTRSS